MGLDQDDIVIRRRLRQKMEMLAEDMHLPLTKVRDPFGTHESFAAHNNARLNAFLDGFGFEYEFISATEFYRSGRFDEVRSNLQPWGWRSRSSTRSRSPTCSARTKGRSTCTA